MIVPSDNTVNLNNVLRGSSIEFVATANENCWFNSVTANGVEYVTPVGSKPTEFHFIVPIVSDTVILSNCACTPKHPVSVVPC